MPFTGELLKPSAGTAGQARIVDIVVGVLVVVAAIVTIIIVVVAVIACPGPIKGIVLLLYYGNGTCQ